MTSVSVNATAADADKTITLTGAEGVSVTGLVADLNASTATGAFDVTAGAGAQTITTGSGDDTITGGAGDDIIALTAGGSDTVVFASTAADNGADTINGFVAGISGDVLDFSAFLTTSSFDTTVFSTSNNGGVDIVNKIVMFDTTGAGLDVAGLVAEIEGNGNAFDLDGEAVVITGNAGGTGNDALVYFVDTSIDGDATNVSSTDVVLVGTLRSFDLDTLAAGNFL